MVFPTTAHSQVVKLEPVSSYPALPNPEKFDQGAAESVAYDPATDLLLITNGADNAVDVVSLDIPEEPSQVMAIDLAPFGKGPTGIDVHNGLAAVTVEAEVKTDPGVVVIFDIAAGAMGEFDPIVLTVGALPDALSFSPDGSMIVVANEGEPNDDYTVDPEGSVSIIRLATMSVETVDFRRYNGLETSLKRLGIRIYGPGASVAQDLEPENIAISPDSTTSWVTLQENNAIAIIDLIRARVKRLIPSGYKFYLDPDNRIDASDKDGAINLRSWPVIGMTNPDGVAAFEMGRHTYFLTANEGDARDYDGFSEEVRVKDLALPSIYESLWPGIQEDENLGRLKTTSSPPKGKYIDEDGNEVYRIIYAYGGRSFSVWSAHGTQIWDSQSELEEIIANEIPEYFNTNNDENKFDSRSDDKGLEPECICVGEVGGTFYAFIGLERQGGVMTFDLSNPREPRFVHYANHRDYSGDPEAGTAGDLGPEDMAFISADASPNGIPLLAVANEVSGTTTIYQINMSD